VSLSNHERDVALLDVVGRLAGRLRESGGGIRWWPRKRRDGRRSCRRYSPRGERQRMYADAIAGGETMNAPSKSTTAVMVVVLLFCTGASPTKSLRLEHGVHRLDEKNEKRAVAVGVPFYVLAKKGLSVNPLEYARGSAVAIERAAVDDPRLLEIDSWDKSAVLVRGLQAGETTLRVEGRVGLQKERASIAVRTAVPTAAALVPLCGDPARRPVWIGAGQQLLLEERLLNGSTVLLSNRYPAVDFGPFTPPANLREKLETSGKAGELIGPVTFEVTAPETPGPALLAIPEFGYTLPVEVFDASAVRGLRFVGDGRAQVGGTTHLDIRFLVNDEIVCGSPAVPVEITIGPTTACDLMDVAPFRIVPEKKPGHQTFEGVIRPSSLSIWAKSANVDCVITAIVKGAVEAAAAATRIAIYAKPQTKSPSKRVGGPRGGHGHH
jgi:hypothetical protein